MWDEKSVPSSNSVELKPVSVVSLKLVSFACEWAIVSIFSIVDASREVFAFSGTFVKRNC